MIPGQHSSDTPTIVFFGTLGFFSQAVLGELLANQAKIIAVVMPGTKPATTGIDKLTSIRIINTPKYDTIELVAFQNRIPVIYVKDINSAEIALQLSEFRCDYITVACFPYLIPVSIWQLPKFASVNLHPSLLPAYAGPSPQFWQLKNGESSIGLTLHKLNEQFDKGEILAQQEVELTNGLSGNSIDALLAKTGAQMIQDEFTQNGLAKRKISSIHQRPATYMPAPQIKDFELSLQWSARHAFNFMRGTQEYGYSYRLVVDGKILQLQTALAYIHSGLQQNKLCVAENVLTIRFAQGILKAQSVSI